MRCGLAGKPCEKAVFELWRSGADGAAVVSVRNFPENCVGGIGMDLTGVPDRNVAIDLTVNEQDWNSGGCD